MIYLLNAFYTDVHNLNKQFQYRQDTRYSAWDMTSTKGV